MADTVILGVYETKTALDTAHASGNTNGDTYIVGSKIPYDLYSWDGSKFAKGNAVSDSQSDLTKDIPVEELYGMKFKGADGKMLMIRKGLHLGEIHFYRPTEDF